VPGVCLHPEPGPKDFCLSAAEAYTRIAADYDAYVAGDAWMRRALQAHYARLFLPSERVLDIGCGSGLDSMFLARRGVQVLALDVSPGMLEQARRNIAAAGLESLVDLRVLDAGALDGLDVHVDGAISAFAALNTVPNLGDIAGALRRLVRPRGRVVVHMLNRFSAWELLGYIARRDWLAARMMGRASMRQFTIGGQAVGHHMFDWRDACAHFTTHGFKLRRAYSLGALRPPHTVQRLPRELIGSLEWLDVRLGDLPLLREVGRFFVLDLERCATQG
jgi:ubiquinone/menaquinone biosynthesis C-methylase UbiE